MGEFCGSLKFHVIDNTCLEWDILGCVESVCEPTNIDRILNSIHPDLRYIVKNAAWRNNRLQIHLNKRIIEYAKQRNINRMNLILDCGGDVHMNYDYALQVAVKNDHLDMVRLLLSRGSNVHAISDQAIRWASEIGSIDVVTLLLEYKANVHALDESPIQLALKNRNLDLSKLLMKYGANIYRNIHVYFSRAIEYGHHEVVQFLINNDHEANIQEHYLTYFLPLAVKNGHQQVVEILVRYGADINEDRGRALIYAVKYNYLQIAKNLITYGANIHANYGGHYAVNLASKICNFDMIKLLIENGAVVRHCLLKTPIIKGRTDIIKFLMNYVNIPNNQFARYVEIADKRKREEILKILKGEMSSVLT